MQTRTSVAGLVCTRSDSSRRSFQTICLLQRIRIILGQSQPRLLPEDHRQGGGDSKSSWLELDPVLCYAFNGWFVLPSGQFDAPAPAADAYFSYAGAEQHGYIIVGDANPFGSSRSAAEGGLWLPRLANSRSEISWR